MKWQDLPRSKNVEDRRESSKTALEIIYGLAKKAGQTDAAWPSEAYDESDMMREGPANRGFDPEQAAKFRKKIERQ